MIIKYNIGYIDKSLDLFIDVFKNDPWNYSWITEEKIRRYFTDLENSPNFLGMLYFHNNVLVGLCLGAINDYFTNKTFDIKEIAIKRNLQGQGIGGEMLNQMKSFLKDLGIDCITLSTQRKIPAFNFYKKNGFQVSDGTVFMSKIIR